ncbi:MAG TPA: cobyrinate a,c-diamide synthase [Bryobacteraceae bacterium]|nr:cobyrinate a,c-diamide synthase [Bryobacteraceae bacterium]
MRRPIPRIVIAGTHSGVGKTSIATALMAAFTRRGLRVQPFKVGPDFIDPGFHEAACGRVSRNLDGWMLSRETNLQVFAQAAVDADVAIVEGVMGLFDGRSAASEEGSTAEMAKWLNAPVLLVADASAMARSAAALVRGFESFDPDLCVAGVVFNRVAGAGHVELLKEAVGAHCRSAVTGCLPHNESIALPNRHLGLKLAQESLDEQRLTAMTDWVESNLNLDQLLGIARDHASPTEIPAPSDALASRVRIGVARDRAFCFYYQDNLDLLVQCGAELVAFSPVADRDLPPRLDGLYLGGGYPELHACELAQNRSMLEAIGQFARSGRPVYAECGGFMYLTEAIVDTDGREHSMVGLFPTRARMQPRLAALGYREPHPAPGALWAQGCENLRGHEFRYSSIDTMPPEIARVYAEPAPGYSVHSVIASYIHLHFLANPEFARCFVEHCAQNQ